MNYFRFSARSPGPGAVSGCEWERDCENQEACLRSAR
jgi:hypothetical protein